MDAAKAVMDSAAAAVPLFVFAAILMLEIGARPMISYYYLYDKIVQPVIDGHIEKGRAQGFAEGRARAKARIKAEAEARAAARMRTQLVEWLARKEEAERQGVPFDEPMP